MADSKLDALTNGTVSDTTLFYAVNGTTDNNVTGAQIKAYAATGGGSTTPGGSDTQVQFNDAGSFNGDTGFTFAKTTKSLLLTSTSARSLGVTSDGTNYLFSVDASTATSVNGVKVVAAATGGTPVLLADGLDANLSIRLGAIGTGTAGLQAAGTTKVSCSTATNTYTNGIHNFSTTASNTAGNTRFLVTNAADAALTTTAEAIFAHINAANATRTHAAGAITLQRDIVASATTHAFASASTVTDLVGLAVNYGAAGNLTTATNYHGIRVPTSSVVTGTGAVTNAYGFTLAAPSGATNNYALNITGASLMGSINGVTLTNAGAATQYLNAAGTYTTPAGGGSGSPGGTSGQIQYNNAGAFGGAGSANIIGGHLNETALAYNDPSPSNPTGSLSYLARTRATRTLPGFIGPNDIEKVIQPHWGTTSISVLKAGPNNAAFATVGWPSVSALGTATARPIAISYYGQVPFVGYVSAAAANSAGGIRSNSALAARAQTTYGGYFMVIRFGVSQYQTGANGFIGMGTTSVPSLTVEPSTLINSVGLVFDSTDTTFSIYTKNATTSTKTSLGANFVANTSSTDVYELRLYDMLNGNIAYYVERLNTGDKVDGTLTTNLPVTTGTTYTPLAYINSFSGTAAVALDINTVYIERF